MQWGGQTRITMHFKWNGKSKRMPLNMVRRVSNKKLQKSVLRFDPPNYIGQQLSFQHFSQDILTSIFTFLSTSDLGNLALTSQRFKSIILQSDESEFSDSAMDFVVSKQGARCLITPSSLLRKKRLSGLMKQDERYRFGILDAAFWTKVCFNHGQGKKLSDANLLSLLRFRIQYLDLSNCTALTVVSLDHLAELSSLTHLRPPRNVEPFTVTTLAVSRCSRKEFSGMQVLNLHLKDCSQLIRRTWHEHPRNPGLSIVVDGGYQSAYHLLTWLSENGNGKVQLDIAFCVGCSNPGTDEKTIATQCCLYCSKYFCLRDRWECDMYDCKICERPSFCRDCFQVFQRGQLKYSGSNSPQVSCPFCKEGPLCSECYITCYSCQKIQCDFCYEYGSESHEKCKICG